jgi:hypothetical protein
MGLQPAGVTHNTLAGDAHYLFDHVRLANQPQIKSVDLCHKTFGNQRFTETRVIRYQPFVSIRNTWPHSECYTIHKGGNKPYENNIILPTNIQYLKIHVCNWICPQTSQWYTGRIWSTSDTLQLCRVHHFTSRVTQLWLPNSQTLCIFQLIPFLAGKHRVWSTETLWRKFLGPTHRSFITSHPTPTCGDVCTSYIEVCCPL